MFEVVSAISGLLGELIALALSGRLLGVTHGLVIPTMKRQFLFVGASIGGAVVVQYWPPLQGSVVSACAAVAYCIFLLLLSVRIFPGTFGELRRIVSEARVSRA